VRVIYVHGVSEREQDSGSTSRWLRRNRRFKSLVADRIGQPFDAIAPAAWGDLRPIVRVPEEGFDAYTEFGEPDTESHNTIADDLADSLISARLDDARFDPAALLEGIYLRAVASGAYGPTHQDELAIENAIASLANSNRKIESDITERSTLEIIETVFALADEEFSTCDSYAEFAPKISLRSIGGTFRRLVSAAEGTARDFSIGTLRKTRRQARAALGLRWADIVWYVGSEANRAAAKSKVLSKLKVAAESIAKKEPIIVLGHSLGGLIAYEALMSVEGRKLLNQAEAPWLFIPLGSQLPVYEQIGVLDAPSPTEVDAHELKLKNIVDVEDPLGFQFGENSIDRPIRTGMTPLLSHTSYLSSAIAMNAIAAAIRESLDI